MFPKGDHANVGVGGWQSEGPKLKEHLRARLRGARARSGQPREPPRPPPPAPRRPGTRIAGERALLVGDAAGLIDPVSGDGMYECFVSSRLAAACDPRPARRAGLDARALRGGRRRRARAAPSRLLEAQEGARPLAARLVAGGPLEAPLGQHPRDARRGATRSEQAARARPRAAAGARDPGPLKSFSPVGRYRTAARLPMNETNGRLERSIGGCDGTRTRELAFRGRLHQCAGRDVGGQLRRTLHRGERGPDPAARLPRGRTRRPRCLRADPPR